MRRVVSASRRTDLPAWYAAWFVRRLREGFASYRSPFSSRVYEVSLRREDVAAFVFWTRDALPFGRALDLLDAEAYPYYFQYTLNGYPADLEPGLSGERGQSGLLALAGRIGPDRVVWRYDPIVLTPGLEPDDHRRRFARLARTLSGSVDTVMVSFLDRYRKVERRLARADRVFRDPEKDEAGRLLLDLQAIARGESIALATCCEEDLRPREVPKGACVDAERIGRIAPDERWKAPARPTREGCGCAESRDIGAYDSCPFGCVYCYAIRSKESAARMRASHREGSPRLLE
ncbi:MAG: DUF1848 domain-containing protein [Candidatus Eisenbacteria bacterium]